MEIYKMRPSLVSAIVMGGFAVTALGEPTAQMKEVLDAYAVLAPVPLDSLAPAVARKAPTMNTAAKVVMIKEGKKAPTFDGTTKDVKIPVAGGKTVKARVCSPNGPGPFPTVLYIHGGGWVIGDLDVYNGSAQAIASMVPAVVVSTDYRKGPSDKFPAAHDDTFAAYQWTLANAAKFKGDTSKVALVDESAGGNMAAAVALMAKEKGIQTPAAEVLVYPVANYAFDTPSYQENLKTKPLNKDAMVWFFDKYLERSEDGNNPRISLLQNKDLGSLPPPTIIAAEIDPLRSEGKALADKIQAAGVKMDYRLYKGVTHEFFGLNPVIDEAKAAEMFAAAQLKAAFAK